MLTARFFGQTKTIENAWHLLRIFTQVKIVKNALQLPELQTDKNCQKLSKTPGGC
jgi:hypothetical protein